MAILTTRIADAADLACNSGKCRAFPNFSSYLPIDAGVYAAYLNLKRNASRQGLKMIVGAVDQIEGPMPTISI